MSVPQAFPADAKTRRNDFRSTIHDMLKGFEVNDEPAGFGGNLGSNSMRQTNRTPTARNHLMASICNEAIAVIHC